MTSILTKKHNFHNIIKLDKWQAMMIGGHKLSNFNTCNIAVAYTTQSIMYPGHQTVLLNSWLLMAT